MPDNIARTPRRCILPIGLLFAGTLWSSNAAYLYLSVSFIQMLKVWRMACCAAPARPLQPACMLLPHAWASMSAEALAQLPCMAVQLLPT